MDSYATLAEEKFDEATALLKSTSDQWFKLVESRTSPAYIGLIAGVAAAASGLTGFAVSAALDGLVMGGQALIDLISGAKNRRELLAAFIAARQMWEVMKPEIARLEQQSDYMLQMLNIAVLTGKSRREALTDIANLLAPVRSKARALEARIAANAMDEVCTTALYKEQWDVVNSVREHLKALCVLDPGNAALASFKELLPLEFTNEFNACEKDGIAKDGIAKTCEAAKANLDTLKDVDSLMHDLGFKIAAGADVYDDEVIIPKMGEDRKSQKKSGRRSPKTERTGERGNRIGRRNEEAASNREFKKVRHKYMMGCLASCRLEVGPKEWPAVVKTLPSWRVETRQAPNPTSSPNTNPYTKLHCLDSDGFYPEPLPAESQEYRDLAEVCDAWWDDPGMNPETKLYMERLARIDEIMASPEESLQSLRSANEALAKTDGTGAVILDSATLREHARILKLVAEIKREQAG
ncbi:MAG: hypothetical protein AAB425_12250, partial [Bdellovibrionota bacterium]